MIHVVSILNYLGPRESSPKQITVSLGIGSLIMTNYGLSPTVFRIISNRRESEALTTPLINSPKGSSIFIVISKCAVNTVQ